MAALTAKHVFDAIEAAANTLPRLTINIGDCHGRDWVADPATDQVFIGEHLDPTSNFQAALDGIAALCDHHGIGRPARLLSLVPVPRGELGHRTGTDH